MMTLAEIFASRSAQRRRLVPRRASGRRRCLAEPLEPRLLLSGAGVLEGEVLARLAIGTNDVPVEMALSEPRSAGPRSELPALPHPMSAITFAVLDPAVGLGSASGAPGSAVTLSLNILDNAAGLESADIEIRYDPAPSR